MKIILEKYILDINVEETRNYYRSEKYVSKGCDCDGCQNYELATEHFQMKLVNCLRN